MKSICLLLKVYRKMKTFILVAKCLVIKANGCKPRCILHVQLIARWPDKHTNNIVVQDVDVVVSKDPLNGQKQKPEIGYNLAVISWTFYNCSPKWFTADIRATVRGADPRLYCTGAASGVHLRGTWRTSRHWNLSVEKNRLKFCIM